MSRARTSNSQGTPRFPAISTYNKFGALMQRRPVRDGSTGSEYYRDTTYTDLDANGNVLRTGTVFQQSSASAVDYTHTRSYFAADNKLRYQQRYAGTSGAGWRGSWEEHWYDALGRKVLTRARRDSLCSGASNYCGSYIERTVWDGDQILYERRGKGGDAETAGTLNTAVASGLYYGQVGYVHAGGIDAPLVLMDGRVPNYNWRGLPESSVWADGTAADCSVSTGGGTCTTIAWPSTGVYLRPVGNVGGNQPQWVGSLLANGVGSTGMAYRRNRFYDGATGQFNQQDPIGLAGGANTYGFVGGDPVSYSDPMGLTPGVLTWPLLIGRAALFGPLGVFVAAVSIAYKLDKGRNPAGATPTPATPSAAPADATRILPTPEDVRGKSPEEVVDMIPPNFVPTPSRTGGGTRYANPDKLGEQVRIMPGNPNDPNPVKRGPYCKISCGKPRPEPIPLKGNPTLPE